MITLITGTPGAGKTLYAVSELLGQYGDRPLFVDGIPDLAIPHLSFPEGGLDQWPTWAPDGAVLVVDEAQRSWRPRPAGSRPPEAIAALETHRHKGVDILLITQHPNLIDQNVRRLVGRHIHVRRVFGWKRAVIYEWDQATDPARVRNAITRTWGYPRSAFKLYRSASMHTARGQRVPWAFAAAVIAAVALPIAIWYAYQRMDQRFNPATATAQAPTTAAQAAAVGPVVVDGGELIQRPDAYVPVVYGRPETAPAYAEIARPVQFPQIVACVSSRTRCACYSQQGTRIDMTDAQCRDHADKGVPFNPYATPRETSSLPNQTAPAPPDAA